MQPQEDPQAGTVPAAPAPAPPTADHYRRQLEAVTNNATLALFIMDERQQCTYMNPAAEQLTGYTLAEVRGRPLHDVIHHTRPDGTPYPLAECPIDQAFPQRMREQGEEVFVHRDGRFYPVAFTASPILENGRPVGTIIEVRDITEEIRAREEILARHREAALSSAVGDALTRGGSLRAALQGAVEAIAAHLDTTFTAIWTLNPHEQVLELEASTGRSEPLDGPHARIPVGAPPIGRIAQQQQPQLENRVGDGAIECFAGYPLLVDGRTVGVLALHGSRTLPQSTFDALRSVADSVALAIVRTRAEEARERLLDELRVERARLATVFQHAPAFIATLRGPEHVFEMANPPYLQLVGHRELIGRTVREALPEVEGQGFFEILDEVYRTGEPFVGTEMQVFLRREPRAGLEERFVTFVYQPLPDASGRTTGILAHGVDVTELVRARRQAEEQAVELEAQAEELQLQALQLEEVQAELQSTNAQIQQTNQELTARSEAAEEAGRAAEEARAILDSFYQAAPVPTALVDRELRFRRINASLAAIYGRTPDEVLGKTLHEVVPHYAGRVEPFYHQVLATGEPIRNLEITLPSGTDPERRVHYLINYFPVRVRGEVIGVGVVALDVTERHAAEEARREHATTVETLHRIGRSIASELDQKSVVQEVTDAATALTGAQFGAFFYNVVNEDGESYQLYTVSGVPRERFSNFPMPRSTPVFGPTFRGEAVVRSADITRDPRYGQLAPYHGMPEGHLPVRSYLAVPVISRTGDVLGGLFFGHEQTGVFTERHEQLATGIAGWAALALDNARLFAAEHRARAEAERANRAKSDFLATMSHELRTPLNAMIGYTDLLLAGVPEPIPPAALQKVERIGISSRHLLELIEEILTFSRLEAGEERLELAEVELGALLSEVQALIEPLALAKEIGFECHAPQDPGTLQSDARKIRQILVNLLGNAIKFTDQGGVSVQLDRGQEGVCIRVSDTGQGIAPEHLEKVFEPFWQVEGGATRTTGGTGLGLSVTRRLARLLGGDVTVTSQVGHGSTFTLHLPARPPRAEA